MALRVYPYHLTYVATQGNSSLSLLSVNPMPPTLQGGSGTRAQSLIPNSYNRAHIVNLFLTMMTQRGTHSTIFTPANFKCEQLNMSSGSGALLKQHRMLQFQPGRPSTSFTHTYCMLDFKYVANTETKSFTTTWTHINRRNTLVQHELCLECV